MKKTGEEIWKIIHPEDGKQLWVGTIATGNLSSKDAVVRIMD